MPLTQMTPGGQWVRPPHDAPAVYVPPKQLESHLKRLVGDGWIPITDPRREEDYVQAPVQPQTSSTELAMQAKIDQLEAMVQQLLTQKSEEANGSQKHDVSADSKSAPDDRGPSRRQSTVR